MNVRHYDSAPAFRQALEQRLRNASKGGGDFARRRQLLVFDRFLARVVRSLGNTVTLKGGLVLELLLERARTTRDIDLRVLGSPDNILERLQQAGRLDLADFLTFEVRPDPEHARIHNDAMRYDGLRYRVEAKLAGKLYGQPFGVDVGFADPILGEPEHAVANDVLGFAGITPPTLPLYPLVSQIAEKLHAYTMPRKRENSRVKDLPDLALLATVREIKAEQLRRALELTFTFRQTHALPKSLPDPPATWMTVYERMADEDALEWRSLAELTKAVRAFLDPVLGEKAIHRWIPARWIWKS